ncbi:MAG: ABC transporter ATP-binding protein [Deltaproteobacteria bacterium]|nr:ABC transporter ATP-binding protein [Deltaproteobacteria bacterium]
MSDTVIKVENLSKKYIIGHEKQERYRALRDIITNGAVNLVKKCLPPFISTNSSFENQTHEEFWALKDISFEIKQGDKVGIIGRNGAGKSTLLKLLSRITEPTNGRFEISGRVASLLEVGTGFHPELTGRENIFLNGAILGMTKAEIKKKFDEIIEFAEIERFLDTPVKRYSSGMYVRLAFAVAAHLETEILIIDEVLAVGDTAFQKKCMGKMHEASTGGKTILFVSHNMAAIQKLCEITIMLDKGRLVSKGITKNIINDYLSISSFEKELENDILKRSSIPGFEFTMLEAINPSSNKIATGEPLIIRAHYKHDPIFFKLSSPAFAVIIKDILGIEIIRLSTIPISGYDIEKLFSTGYIELFIPFFPLVGGSYSVDILLLRQRKECLIHIESALLINVDEKDIYDSGTTLNRKRGLIALSHSWNHQNNANIINDNSIY